MKITEAVERVLYTLQIIPVIIQTVPEKFSEVFAFLRQCLPPVRWQKTAHVYPLIREIKTFNYIAALLPRDMVEDLNYAKEVEKVYLNNMKFAFQYPTVPEDAIFQWSKGLFKHVAPFTTTYYTRKLVGADKANEKGYCGNDVNVVVTDTGLSRRNPATRDMTFDTVIIQHHDDNGHGEWCSACVGGRYSIDTRLSRFVGREIPTEGMAPMANVTGIKCLGYLIGTGSDDAILKAIELGITRYRADVISMSLGGKVDVSKQEDDPYYRVIHDLTERGVVFCVAAGNSGPRKMTVGSPGWIEDSLTVGAYNELNGKLCDFSSRGPTPDGRIKPDTVAPGFRVHAPICGILDRAGDNMDNNFSPISGTSMATPHITGLVACMKQAHLDLIGRVLTTSEIKKMLSELGHAKTNEDGWGPLTWGMYEEWMSTEYGVTV